jgi:hypothetical protein
VRLRYAQAFGAAETQLVPVRCLITNLRTLVTRLNRADALPNRFVVICNQYSR